MNTQIYLSDTAIYPTTRAEIIEHNNSNVAQVLDNFQPVSASEFGRKILVAQSMAEVARLMHHNYSFAEDATDGVKWTIKGAPQIDSDHAKIGSALHTSNGNYICRKLTLGKYDFDIEFDFYCTDTDKIFFQFDNNATTPSDGSNATREWLRFSTVSTGLQFKYLTQKLNLYNSYSVVTVQTESFDGDFSSIKHLKISHTKSDNEWNIFLDDNLIGTFTRAIANKAWYIYLGYNVEAWFDNLIITNNGETVSSLDFE